MSAQEWLTIGVFVGTVWAVSLWNGAAAAMIAGALLVIAFVNSDIPGKFIKPSATGSSTGGKIL